MREPLLQFLILGTILFVVVTQCEQHANRASREIVVDIERVNLMIVNYTKQNGHIPSKEQVDALIENYILEEIMYREALKMGLDQDDEIIRRRLAQKFQFIQSDLAELRNPTEEELKKFYADHPDYFQDDARVSFSHIYFSTDNSSDSIAKQRAIQILAESKLGHLTHTPEKGDRFPLQYDYTDQSNLDIRQNFGDKPILDTLFYGKLKTWLGPAHSGLGWHLVYILNRKDVTTNPYPEIRDEVKAKFMEDQKAEQNKRDLEKLVGKYSIQRVYLNSK